MAAMQLPFDTTTVTPSALLLPLQHRKHWVERANKVYIAASEDGKSEDEARRLGVESADGLMKTLSATLGLSTTPDVAMVEESESQPDVVNVVNNTTVSTTLEELRPSLPDKLVNATAFVDWKDVAKQRLTFLLDSIQQMSDMRKEAWEIHTALAACGTELEPLPSIVAEGWSIVND